MQTSRPPAADLASATNIRFYGTLVRYPLLSHLLLLLLWLLLWRVSALMEYAPYASIWFPPAGMSFATFLLLGWRGVPAIACGCIMVTFWENSLYGTALPAAELWLTGLLFSMAHIGAYFSGAAVLRRFIQRAQQQHLPPIILAFIVIGPLSALLAALLTQLALQWGGILQATADNAYLWLPLWIGDLIGIIVLTPLFIGIVRRVFPRYGGWVSEMGLNQVATPRRTFLLKLALGLLLVTLIMLLTANLHLRELAFAIFFMGIPQLWIVYTETPLRSAISIALMSCLTALLVKELGQGQDALIYQFAMSVLAASTYFGLLIPVLASSNSHLRELANRDALTHTCSRLHFFPQAELELQRARYYRQPVSLVVFDIDNFKHINDNYGHTTGDKALVSLVNEVSSQLRQADMLGRFGGDEFMLLLPGSQLAEACVIAERLRQQLPQIAVNGLDKPLTGSFGVTEIRLDDSIANAFERADNLLLQAKRAGRNRVLSEAELV